MSKTLFTDLTEIGVLSSLIDNTQFRNVMIRTYYEALQDIDPEMLYAEKIKMLAIKYELSVKSIDAIICSQTQGKANGPK